MRKYFHFSLSVAILASVPLLSGCFTYNTLTTGRSLGKGGKEITASLSSFYQSDTELSAPILPQARYTHGITNRLDLSGQLGFGTLGIGAKYQVVGNQTSQFCMAPSLSFEYFGLGLGDGDEEDDNSGRIQFHFTNLSATLNTSFHPSEKVAIYFSPKYVRLWFGTGYKSDDVNSSNSASVNLIGLTPGIEFGNRVKFCVEGTLLSPNPTDENFSTGFATLSLGARFRLGKK